MNKVLSGTILLKYNVNYIILNVSVIITNIYYLSNLLYGLKDSGKFFSISIDICININMSINNLVDIEYYYCKVHC